jgi:hypothetical protein
VARNIQQLMDGAVVRLGDPRAQTPSAEQLLHQTCSQIRTLLRAKQNVSNIWNFNETFVEVTPGEDTYQLTPNDFGTPLVVTTVPENANQIVRIIPFYCPQNLDYSWGWAQSAAAYWPSPDGSNCNAVRCAIFWQNNLPYIRFNPIPQLTPASYKVQYLQNANNVGVASLNAMPLPDADCDVVEIRTATSLLALAEWSSPLTKDGVAANAEKRRNLGVTLANDERMAYEQFLIGNRITTGPHIRNRWSTCVE